MAAQKERDRAGISQRSRFTSRHGAALFLGTARHSKRPRSPLGRHSSLKRGFLIGMHHALEPDHIAAVSSMAARQSKVQGVVKHGLTWDLGTPSRFSCSLAPQSSWVEQSLTWSRNGLKRLLVSCSSFLA